MEKEKQNGLTPEQQTAQDKKRADNGMLVAAMAAAGMLLGYILGKMVFEMPVMRFLCALVMGGVVGGAFSRLLKK